MREQNKKMAELIAVAEETLGNMRTVKAFANELHEINKFEIINKHFGQILWK